MTQRVTRTETFVTTVTISSPASAQTVIDAFSKGVCELEQAAQAGDYVINWPNIDITAETDVGYTELSFGQTAAAIHKTNVITLQVDGLRSE